MKTVSNILKSVKKYLSSIQHFKLRIFFQKDTTEEVIASNLKRCQIQFYYDVDMSTYFSAKDFLILLRR